MVNLGSSCKPNTGTELIEFSGLQFADPGTTGYGKAMDVFEKFLADMGEVIQNHPGEVPLIVSGFMDTLTLEPHFRKEESK